MKVEQLGPIPSQKLTDVDQVALEVAGGVPARRVDPIAMISAGRTLEKGLAFSPDGKTLIRGGKTGTVCPIDLGNPKKPKRKRPTKADQQEVNSVAVTPDGAHWLSCSGAGDGTIKVWNATLTTLVRTFEHGETPHWVRAVGDDRVISVGYETMRIWKLSTGTCVRKIDHEGRVEHFNVTPDGTRAITAHTRGVVNVWNLTTGTLERTIPRAWFFADDTDDSARAVALSADGTSFVSCGRGVVEMTLDGELRGQLAAVDAHPVYRVAYLPDRAISLRSRASDTEKDFLGQLDDEGARLAYADWLEQDGRLAEATSIRRGGSFRYALALVRNALHVVDLASGLIAARTILTGKGQGFDELAVSPDGRFAVVGTRAVSYLFDVDELLRAGVHTHDERIWQRAVSNGGLVINGFERTGLLTSIRGDRAPLALQIPYGLIRFTSDDRFVFMLSTEHTLRVFDTATGAHKGHFKHPVEESAPQHHVVLRDGRLLVGSVSLPLTIWGIDPVTADVFDGTAGHVTALAVDEDAGLVATGTWVDQKQGGPMQLGIWNLATKQLVRTTEVSIPPAQYITALAFVGDWIVAGTSAGALLRFDRQGTLERAWNTGLPMVAELVVLPNHRVVFSSHTPILFDVAAGTVVGTLHGPEDTRYYFVEGTTRAMVSRIEAKTVTLVDLATATRYAPIDLDAYNVDASPDGRYLAIHSEDPASARVVLRVTV